jgi:hypothetical protein
VLFIIGCKLFLGRTLQDVWQFVKNFLASQMKAATWRNQPGQFSVRANQTLVDMFAAAGSVAHAQAQPGPQLG